MDPFLTLQALLTRIAAMHPASNTQVGHAERMAAHTERVQWELGRRASQPRPVGSRTPAGLAEELDDDGK